MKICRLIIFLLLIISTSSFAGTQLKSVIAVTGSIFNYVDKSPISVEIEVYDNVGKKVNSTKSNATDNGYYYVTGLYSGNIYTFIIKDQQYLTESFEVSIPNSDKYVEISKDFLLKPNKAGTEIKLNINPFEYDKFKLKVGAATILSDVLNTVKNNSNKKFNIICYPDSDQDANENHKITEARAKALVDFFELNGIDGTTFTIQSNQKSDPKNPPPTEKRAKGKNYVGSIYLVVN